MSDRYSDEAAGILYDEPSEDDLDIDPEEWDDDTDWADRDDDLPYEEMYGESD